MQALRDLVLTFSQGSDGQSSPIAPETKPETRASSHKPSRSRRDLQGQTQVLDWAQKTLRAPQNQRVRVNQFEIDEHYQGLVEKFFVLNREDLANALEDCIQKLGSRSHDGCVPEVLSLLLELSDDPLTATDFNEYKGHVAVSNATPSVLNWADIVRDDPLSDDDLWRDEHYDTSSDGDDDESIVDTESTRPDKPRSNPPSHVGSCIPQVNDLLVSTEEFQLSDIENSLQTLAKRRDRGDDIVSEAYLTREVLSMLRGAPCSIYHVRDDNIVDLSSQSDSVKTLTLTNDSIVECLQSFASLGSALYCLRVWLQIEQNMPFYQRLQIAVSRVIDTFNRILSDFENLLINAPSLNADLYGLINLEARLQPSNPVFDNLSAIFKSQAAHSDEILFLNILYKHLCIADSALDNIVFEQLLSVWSEVLDVYLRPLDHWMSQGLLEPQYGGCMIEIIPESNQVSTHSSAPCALRRRPDGSVNSPIFITQDMAERILNAGKTVRIMSHIDPDAVLTQASSAPWKSGSRAGQAASEHIMITFSQQLDTRLHTWISENSSQSFAALKDHLWSRCHLGRHLDALDHLYLSRDGSLFSEMAQGLSKRLSKAHVFVTRTAAYQADGLSLTEVAREAFASCTVVDGSRITVHAVKTSSAPHHHGSVLVDIGALRLTYKLPWPTTLILRDTTSYQMFQGLLLQIIYAKQLVEVSTNSPRGLGAKQRRHLGVRQKLIWFLDILQYYLVEVVAVQSAGRLRRCLAEASSIDAKAEGYKRFADQISAAIFESKNARPLRGAIHDMLDLIVRYHAQSQSRPIPGSRQARAPPSPEHSDGDSGSTDDEDQDVRAAKLTSGLHQTTTNDSFLSLDEVDSKFSRLLRFLLAGLKGITVSDNTVHQAYQMLAERLECAMTGSNGFP